MAVEVAICNPPGTQSAGYHSIKLRYIDTQCIGILGAIIMPREILKRPTSIMLGIGEAGQNVMYHVEKLAYNLGILDPVTNPEKEKEKILVYLIVSKSRNVQSKDFAGFREPRLSGNEGTPSPSMLLKDLMERSEELNDIDKVFIKPTKARIELEGMSIDDLAKLVTRLSPVVSSKYGLSMMRIDSDERTLRSIGEAIHNEGLPVPPGIIIATKEMKIRDPVLDEEVLLQPTGGSGGRSATVYQLLKHTESSLILDLLGIPVNIKSPQISMLQSSLPSYRTFLLMHGMVGTGAGAVAAILDSLGEVYGKDVLSSMFKMDFVIIPSAEEAHLSKHDPSRWIRVFQWDLGNLLKFMENEILDTAFIIDLDFAIMQYRRNQAVEKEGLEAIKKVNSFMKNILDGKLKLYKRDELKKYTGLSPSTLFNEYKSVDELIAYTLEPILCILGPRTVRFGAGGSSVDEMELKDLMKGLVAIPMISPTSIFNTYLEITKRSIEKGFDPIDEGALTALLLPVLHGLMAPVVRDIVKGFIIVISGYALERLDEELGYVPTISDVAAVFRETFTSRAYIKILVSSTSVATSVVVYALADPKNYLNHVVGVKGW